MSAQHTVLITGGGGFIGSHLAENFLKLGYQVVCVDNFCTGFKKNKDYLLSLTQASNGLIFLEEDCSWNWSWTEKIPLNFKNSIRYVFHFASPASPPLYQKLNLETMWVNTVGLKNALEFSDAVGARLIFASTSEIYGNPQVSPQTEDYWGNVNTVGIRSCYDEAKRFGESLVFTHNWRKNTKHGLVRIFNTYGPRMNPSDGRVIINFLVQALNNQPLTVYGSGSQTRSFCYVDDLISGIIKYALTELTEPVNIGNDKEFSILDAANVVKELFPNKNLNIEFQPLPTDDPLLRRPNLSKATKLLKGWKPEVSLNQGLKKMIEWLEQEKFERE